MKQSDYFYTEYLFDGANVRNAVKFTSKQDPATSYTFPLVVEMYGSHAAHPAVEAILGPVFIDIANKVAAQKAAFEQARRNALPDAKEEFPLS